MLLRRAFVDDGAFHARAAARGHQRQSNLRGASSTACCWRRWSASAGTLLGFLFAFTVERARRRGAGCALLDAVDAAAADLAAVHHLDRHRLLVRARGLITHDLLGLTNVQVYGLTSTFAAETLTYFPIAYLALRPMLAAIGPILEEVAFSLGGSRWHVFRTVTLPLTVPGLANAFLLLFGCSLADFATPLILAGNDFPVLPTEAYLQITGMFDLKGGAVLSLLLLVPAGLVFYLLQRYWSPAAPMSPSPARPAASRAQRVSRPGRDVLLLAFCVRGRRLSSSISMRCCSTPRSC